ncbi:hypothetical protein EDB86DRAFT_3107098 [Lactarius hatsudake]|nr:hypothetical protein EDB86DRAFT_3107098 [Lactarius hatsudake]
MRVSPPSGLMTAVLVPGRVRGRRAAELSCPVAVVIIDLTIKAVLVTGGLPLFLQPTPSPSLLSEIFAVFRSVAMPRYSAEQHAFNAAPFTLVDDADDRCSAPHARRVTQQTRDVDARSVAMLAGAVRGTAADAPLAVATHAILDTSGLP